jgi:LacI family transcriptional regulator
VKSRSTSKAQAAVTTKDIAERTALSKMTVSRVLNNHPYVSEETRRKVMEAVREMGFRPNTLAKRFFTGRTQLIGVVIPLEYMFSSFYFAELFRGVLERAQESGYDILLHNSTSPKRAPMDKCMDLVKGKLVEGLLVAAPMSYDDYPYRLSQEAVPLVVMGETVNPEKVCRVTIPNRKSSEEAVARLIKKGHRKIAILAFDKDHVESEQRVAGYKDALRAAGLDFDPTLLVNAHYNRREAVREVQRLISERPDVTALFAANADMALGAADGLRSVGRNIPDAVSLVGFDDCAEMEQYDPPLSTVRQFPTKLGHAACDMLLGILAGDGKWKKGQCRSIETEYMDRDSISAPTTGRGSE